MWDGYCGNVIRRVNRNLLLAILGIAAVVLAFVYVQRQYLIQFFRGTTAVDASLVTEHPVQDQFVRVHLPRVINTGIQHTTTDHGVKSVDSEYYVTVVAGRLLVLRVPGGVHDDEMDDYTFEGRVRPLSPELRQQLEDRRSADLPPLADWYIDGKDFRSGGITALVLGVPLLIWWAWLILHYQRGSIDLSQHTFARRIARFGLLDSMVQEIDAQMAAVHPSYSRRGTRVEITRDWLLVSLPFSAYAVHLDHLLWAHPFVFKRKLYMLITVNKKYFLHVYDDLGKKFRVPRLTEQQIASILRDLAARSPRAIYGYHRGVAKLWRRFAGQPERFLTEAGALSGQVRTATAQTSSIRMG